MIGVEGVDLINRSFWKLSVIVTDKRTRLCVCACARACVRACVCVCVRARARACSCE